MFLSPQFKLQPIKKQYEELASLSEKMRLLYNAALTERKLHYEYWKRESSKHGLAKPNKNITDEYNNSFKSITKFDQQKSLTMIRNEDSIYGSIPANMARWSLSKINDAFNAWFSDISNGKYRRYPRYKYYDKMNSFGFAEFSGIQFQNGYLKFKGITGKLKVHCHRELPPDAVIKSCVFSYKIRTWYVTFQIEVPDFIGPINNQVSVEGNDIGVTNILTSDKGEMIENPRIGKKLEDKLVSIQRKMSHRRTMSSKTKYSSNRYQKLRLIHRRVNQQLVNTRITYAHQLSARKVRENNVLVFEDLRLKNMTKSAKGTIEEPGKNVKQKSGLNRSLLDVGAGRLVSFIDYKMKLKGGLLVKVDPKNTSLNCSNCGTKIVKEIYNLHSCHKCGLELHRDVNAAINIRNRGIKKLGLVRVIGNIYKIGDYNEYISLLGYKTA